MVSFEVFVAESLKVSNNISNEIDVRAAPVLVKVTTDGFHAGSKFPLSARFQSTSQISCFSEKTSSKTHSISDFGGSSNNSPMEIFRHVLDGQPS
ncbi:unnamed protein product [Hymenolepis diminuta]|uniref:Uncharacterized protein n=1 Tax=Hymenolepis diminuta TaxID=6216 RepID=A0A564YYC7_HYMDI|nr:unnamed protein product [Hymenolepis diminuta]